MPTLKKQRNQRGKEIRKATGIPFHIAHRIAKLELNYMIYKIADTFPQYSYLALVCGDAGCCGHEVRLSKDIPNEKGIALSDIPSTKRVKEST